MNDYSATATRAAHRTTLFGLTKTEWNSHVRGCVPCATEEVQMAEENLRVQKARYGGQEMTASHKGAHTRLSRAKAVLYRAENPLPQAVTQ